MIQSISIKNFKSIADETIELGRINVFIGENGCGKSNLLEAVAFASAVDSDNMIADTSELYEKGMREAMPSLIFNSFLGEKQSQKIEIILEFEEKRLPFSLKPADNNNIYSTWKNDILRKILKKPNKIAGELQEYLDEKYAEEMLKWLKGSKTYTKALEELSISTPKQFKEIMLLFWEFAKNSPKTERKDFIDLMEKKNLTVIEELLESESNYLRNYLIYGINTKSLRGIYTESRKQPLGINGEGLDVLIANLDKTELATLKEYKVISWLDEFFVDNDDRLKLKGYKANRGSSKLYFSDRYMQKKNQIFSSENANEGILHVLFYLTLMISKRTPKFFGIDNIESCLNPHLCREVMTQICSLAKKETIDKQVLITTHNPAILDGLNLNDDEIRLFEVYRNDKGHTKTRRIKLNPDNKPEKYKLSELWMRGYFGGNSNLF